MWMQYMNKRQPLFTTRWQQSQNYFNRNDNAGTIMQSEPYVNVAVSEIRVYKGGIVDAAG